MTDFIPVDEEQMRELYDNAPAGSHARDVWNELQRTEKERARVQALLDAAIAGRNALRADLQTELMAERAKVEALTKRECELNDTLRSHNICCADADHERNARLGEEVAEVVGYAEGFADGKKGDKVVEWAPGHGPQAVPPRFVETMAQQREVDEQTRAFAAQIVADRKLQTLDDAKAFAQGWIETAVQYGRNVEYLAHERDKLQALIDGAVV